MSARSSADYNYASERDVAVSDGGFGLLPDGLRSLLLAGLFVGGDGLRLEGVAASQ